ncbi:MAG: RNA polymerase sigma factor [Planctomycetota bacterium]
MATDEDAQDVRERIVELHTEAFGWARACCADAPERAEDILQEAYVRVLDGRARFAGGASFRTFLFGVIHNVAREERRRRGAGPRLLDLDVDLPAASEPDAEAEGLRRALAALSPRQREVVHLVYYQGLTVDESARVLGIGVGSARQHFARGKERLRALLQGDPRIET